MMAFLKGLIPATVPWRLIGVVLALICLLGSGWLMFKAIDTWNANIYARGYKAGSDSKLAEWNAANSEALQAQRDKIVADAAASNKSVRDYLADIAAKEPKLVQVKERTTIYEKSAAGGEQCLDADGVGLLEDNRKALGATAPGP